MTAAREARQRRRYAPLAEHIAWPISEAIFAQIHSFALDEGDAFNTAAEIFDDVIACLRRDPVFAHHSTADLEFRFGDLRLHLEHKFSKLLDGAIDRLRLIIASPSVVGVGDALFAGALSQTWRWAL